MASPAFHGSIRKYHRVLGFFLAGIMALYSVSGVILIFRNTDFLKSEQTTERQLNTGLHGEALGQQLRLRDFKITAETESSVTFGQGNYDKKTGVATVTNKDYPAAIAKMVKLHKATTDSPLYYLNIFFGLSLLFYVISAFLMFIPKLPQYKTGLKIAGAGFVFALLVVIFGSS